jgi:hypothetical protein
MQLGWKCSKRVRTNNNSDEASNMVEKRCQERDIRRISIKRSLAVSLVLSYYNTLLCFSKLRDVK